MRSWIGLVISMVLCGCQTAVEQASLETPPANYRQIAAAHMRKSLFDPYSARDAQIAAPKRAAGPSLNSDGFYTGWVICVRVNAKNRFGAYTGLQDTALVVNNRTVVNAWDEMHYSGLVCGDARYEPFPEIEGSIAGQARR